MGCGPRPAGLRERASEFLAWVLLLAAGWLVQAGLRAWFSRMQGMPLANPDETAYLIAARVLAGGPGADLSGSTLYQGGYPLLITPVYWFTSNPGTVYHAVMIVNAAVSATVLPLGYLICRRLGLGRPAAYGVATVAALVPAAFFYSQYAMTDAVFPVVTLAWLLVTHSWLNPSAAASPRGRYAAAAGSALLSGYAYMIHSRGLVMLAGYAAVGAFIAWRRPAARFSVALAGLIAVPQLYEITWTELQFFNPASQPPPAGVTVVEVPWRAGQTAQESWPNAPAGWRIVASDQSYEWVAWRAP